MGKILEDIRILDFTHVWFGPFCTMMLAEMGAEVIKVEPPWGTLGRYGPGELFHGASTTFYSLNINKKDISIDLKHSDVKEIIEGLVKKSDVVVQNFTPGTMERLGLGYEVLKEWNPRIVYAALSGFGQTGPYSRYSSYTAIAEAISGHTYATGKGINIEHKPVTMAGAIGDLGPAMYAAFAIVAAIRHRDRTGEGQMIDVSQVDAMVALNCCDSIAYSLLKKDLIQRQADRIRDPNLIWTIIPVKDGWIQLAGERVKGIENLKKELGVEELSRDLVTEKIKDMTRMEAFKWLADLGFPSAPIYEAYEAMYDPHLIARDMWRKVAHPNAGEYKVPNFPVKFSKTPGEIRTSAPMLGQHTREVLVSLLSMNEEELDSLEKQNAIVQWKG